jgi:hypothetical protein
MTIYLKKTELKAALTGSTVGQKAASPKKATIEKKGKTFTVPYHGGGRSKKINAWYLNTHMVYL